MNKLLVGVGAVALLAVLALGVSLPKGGAPSASSQGPQGVQGVQGERGFDGDKGIKGDKGEKGDHGKDGLEISVGDIKNKLESLKGDERLDASAIKGLAKRVRAFQDRGALVLGGGGGGGQATFPTVERRIYNEIPAGSINDSNVTFTLASPPVNNSAQIYLNGLRQAITTDFTITNASITFTNAPPTGSILLADYSY